MCMNIIGYGSNLSEKVILTRQWCLSVAKPVNFWHSICSSGLQILWSTMVFQLIPSNWSAINISTSFWPMQSKFQPLFYLASYCRKCHVACRRVPHFFSAVSLALFANSYQRVSAKTKYSLRLTRRCAMWVPTRLLSKII